MWDIVIIGLKGLSVALAVGPFVAIVGYGVWIHSLEPRLIPQAEIDRLAQALIDREADPEHAAFIEHHAAWFRSNFHEQGKWRRVRKTLRSRRIDAKKSSSRLIRLTAANDHRSLF
jgi:hypothetical protein